MNVLLIWLLLIFDVCFGYHTILFATQKDIRVSNTSKPKKFHVIIKDLNDAVAVDYLYNGSLICWTDHGLELIQCAPFNGTQAGSKMTVARMGISSPDGLACDWLTKKLYWTDSETNRIEVISLESRYRRVLFWQEIDQPRGIAVDPLEGVLFWTDWGETPKIEKAAMNGDLTSRKTIISENIFWPNSISLDVQAKRMYWIDGKYQFIEVCDYDGRNRRTIAEKGITYPYSLTSFGDRFYWSDWKTHSIHSLDRKNGGDPRELIHGDFTPMDIKIWDELRQPYKYTPCDTNNGGCSHLCLLAPYPPGYSCSCPTGIKLVTNVTCAAEVEEFLLLVQRSEISRVSLDSPDHTNIVLPLKGLKHSVSIDFDPVDGYFYWTDDELRSVRRAKMDGSGQEDVITVDVSNPDGIAIDWAGRNLYWSDTTARRIEVARLDGKYRKVLVFEDLGDPRAVAVSPDHGWLFWSDWNEKKPKIERSDLDGANRLLVVKEDLVWPNGIALDVATSKLYWGDAKVDKIETINMDGTERREILGDNLPHIFGLTLLGEYLYWTDWQRKTVEKMNKHSGRERQIILDSLPNVMGLKAASIRAARHSSSNGCTQRNGDCEQLCFASRDGRYACACEIDYELNADNRTCLKPEAFLIFYSDDDRIRRISIEKQHRHRSAGSFGNGAGVIPLTDVKSVTAIDVDANDYRLYWADGKLKTISRAYLNGSQSEKIIEFGLFSVESIAVDWLSDNVYWIDTGNGRIEVSSSVGLYRKVLFWKNLKSPRHLALAPQSGFMYWSEWWNNKHGSIVKASMDGSWREVLVDERVGRVNGLTVDYAQRQLYWSAADENGYALIEKCDLNGNDRNRFNVNRYKPFSIAHYGDHLFTVNWDNGSVVKMSKRRTIDDNDATVIYSSDGRISDLKIVHASKPSGWNPCAAENNNAGCVSGLCLISRSPHSTAATVANCTCPTHYFRNDVGVCSPPNDFLLVAQRNQFSRIVPDVDDCPDYPLAISGYRNIRAVEYDPISKLVYWIDGKIQAIRRSYENGSNSAIFLDNPSVSGGRYNHFYDIALDPINRLLFWTCSATDTINVTRLLNSLSVGVVYKANDGEKPRSIALHPMRGLLFWTDVGGGNNRIMRARLDGHKLTTVVSDARTIEAFAVDRFDHLVYYAVAGKIFYCDLTGADKKSLPSGGGNVVSVTGLTVMGDFVYWIDKEYLQRTNKFPSDYAERETVVEQTSATVTDLITVSTPSSAQFRSHPCSELNNHNGCSHLCVIVAEGNSSNSPTSSISSSATGKCLCPIGLKLNKDGLTCSVIPACGEDHFSCASSTGECLPNSWRCDGQIDCHDKSDELRCTQCMPNQFRCHSSGRCIDTSLLCDGTDHCGDRSDEMKCCSIDDSGPTNFSSAYFRCLTSGECIPLTTVCDAWKDCSDGSDETKTICDTKTRIIKAPPEGYTDDTSIEFITFAALILIIFCLMVASFVAFVKFKKRLKPPIECHENAALNPMTTRCPLYATEMGVLHHNTLNKSLLYGTACNSNELGRLTSSGVPSSSPLAYPLNPPPSPATTTEFGDEYYSPYPVPPPPTPCYTDVCDSDFC